MTDTFGDGGGTVTIFSLDDASVAATLDLPTGNEITESFCVPDGCFSIIITTDAFPGEVGAVITTQDGVVYELIPGGDLSDTTVDFGNTGNCDIDGCMDSTALNFNPDANLDCLGVEGGTDFTCCNYPIANNDCFGAIELVPGVEANWDTTVGTDPSGNSCSPTLTNDVWYTFTPTCEMEVTIVSTSGQGGELGIWEGDCEGGALTNVACGPNGGFTAVTLEALLLEGVTYYIQTGSNSDFGFVSTGTILLTEGDCRGCTYPQASNFDVNAVDDNGTCMIEDCSCPGDFNNSGDITASDLTSFLSVFGQDCE